VTDQVSAALEATLQRYGVLVRSIGRRNGLADEDVSELLQAVRIRLWRALGDGERISAVGSSYVYHAATSAAVDMIRSRRRKGAPGPDSAQLLEGTVALNAPDTELMDREGAARILAAVEDMPQARRTAVKLYLAGYRREEIARMLQWSEARTRNLIYRGLDELRGRLTALGLAPEGGAR
jgi:RNA polymerase sigma-70 factor (ECF subfamily)